MLRMAALVQALEALGLCAAAVAQAVEAATGRSYSKSSGIALAVLELVVAVGLACLAIAIARMRPWSRTPAVMTQLCCGLLGIILLQAHRPEFGTPALVLAVAGLAGLFHPASLKALRRQFGDAPPAKGAAAKPTAAKPATAKPATGKPPTAKSATPGAPKPAKGGATPAGSAGRPRRQPRGASGKAKH
jgi:hypothetical protein